MDGKKSIAEKIMYQAIETIEKRNAGHSNEGTDSESGSSGSGLNVFKMALDNIKPTVEVRSRRVGGATYQVPVEVRGSRGVALAMRWLVQSARARSEHGMTLRLAGEMMDAYHKKGSAYKKREDTHRMAKANQAFAHFRWN